MSDNHERTLQIGFGIVGVLSTVITLASLHHRDSLGCMLFRQLFLRRNERPSSDPESVPLNVNNVPNQALNHYSRQTTLPPSYDTSTRFVSDQGPSDTPSAHGSTMNTTTSAISSDPVTNNGSVATMSGSKDTQKSFVLSTSADTSSHQSY